MRIVSVVDTFPRLSETFILRKALALAERGHEIVIYARERGAFGLVDSTPSALTVLYPLAENDLRHPARFLAFLRQALVLIARSPISSLQLLACCILQPTTRGRPLVAFLRHLPFIKLKADVVHLEFLDLAATYPLLNRLVQAPVVISCRGADLHAIHTRAPMKQAAAKAALTRAAAIHCVSDEMAEAVKSFCGRTTGVWVNRPAVPTEAISMVPRRAAQSPPLMLAAGRLVHKKGFDVLLSAASILKRRGITFQLRIIGDGPDRASLAQRILELGLEGDVTLAGAVRPGKVFQEMQAADLFVLSSREEGISNAALEAMASGLPVVTTDAGGMIEAVRDGVDGIVVPVEAPDRLADAIVRLLSDAQLRSRMGRSGSERAAAEFSLSRQARLFEEMYECILRPKPLS